MLLHIFHWLSLGIFPSFPSQLNCMNDGWTFNFIQKRNKKINVPPMFLSIVLWSIFTSSMSLAFTFSLLSSSQMRWVPDRINMYKGKQTTNYETHTWYIPPVSFTTSPMVSTDFTFLVSVVHWVGVIGASSLFFTTGIGDVVEENDMGKQTNTKNDIYLHSLPYHLPSPLETWHSALARQAPLSNKRIKICTWTYGHGQTN